MAGLEVSYGDVANATDEETDVQGGDKTGHGNAGAMLSVAE